LRRIVLAKHIGFCSGVKRAVNLAYEAAKESKVYSLGPLIHNPQEVKRLERAGIKVIKTLGNLKKGILIVRSHGLPGRVIGEARKRGLKIIDATCPLVKKVQEIAGRLKERRYQIVMVADRYHPEVKAVQERAGRKFQVVPNGKKPMFFPRRDKIGVIAQTTQSEKNFREVINQLKIFNKGLKIYNTICQETARRQRELLGLAKTVDVVLIIGGFNSANTRRLLELSRQGGIVTYQIEESKGLRKINLKGIKKIGIVTGASTPNWIVEEVVRKLEIMPER